MTTEIMAAIKREAGLRNCFPYLVGSVTVYLSQALMEKLSRYDRPFADIASERMANLTADDWRGNYVAVDAPEGTIYFVQLENAKYADVAAWPQD